ncbi:MAG TPA: TRAP transporter substrate-binding protein DctP [Opitutaceae bacterium]|nr:TRAP transporter substrate-binding protein DctP [Opitutaceae bacterium]
MRLASLLLLLAALSAPAAPADKPLRINLGTLAPRGSSYHQALQGMGEAWRTASNGRVKLVIYPDGTQGTEADMVRLMRIGALQAGLLTSTGLELIEDSVAGLQKLPFMLRDLAEFDHIMRVMSPRLERKFDEKGFHVLFWSDAGWLRLFSTEAAVTPDDFARLKIFVWADPKQAGILKQVGQNPVSLETNDLPAALQTGLVTAMPAPPIFVLATQLDRRARHMLRVNYAPLVGAAVITKSAWEAIPEALRTELAASAARTGDQIRAHSRTENEESVVAMQKRGLIVHELTPSAREAWQALGEKAYPLIRGELIPADIFDEVQHELAEYRAHRGSP